MKQALVAAGVDTSSCFERSDLEGKYALLTDDQKAMKGDASAASAGASAAGSGSGSGSDAS